MKVEEHDGQEPKNRIYDQGLFLEMLLRLESIETERYDSHGDLPGNLEANDAVRKLMGVWGDELSRAVWDSMNARSEWKGYEAVNRRQVREFNHLLAPETTGFYMF
jgi:hypothetical protein